MLKRQKFEKPYKLNLGCGDNYLTGWINIDDNSHNMAEKLDITMNLTHNLPFENNSVAYIHNEHFLEHLTRPEGLAFIKECYRVLQTGGVLRISTPNLDEAVDIYKNKTFADLPVYKKYDLHRFASTPCQYLNMSFREWGHQFIYDEPELRMLLKEAGFHPSEVTGRTIGESKHSALVNIESRTEGMVFEATKSI